MSGKHITQQQVRLYMNGRKQSQTQVQASAKAGMSERTGQRIDSGRISAQEKKERHWRTRKDPFEEVWDSERCQPWRAKRRLVVPGRRRSGRIFAVAKGGVSRSRGENLQGHPTRRQAICGRSWARRVLVESSADRRAAGAQRLSRRRVDFGDWDVPKSFTR